jgi:hypothetical protein
MEYIALDVHKHYTWARVENDQGHKLYESKLAHSRGTIKNFTQPVEPRNPSGGGDGGELVLGGG